MLTEFSFNILRFIVFNKSFYFIIFCNLYFLYIVVCFYLQAKKEKDLGNEEYKQKNFDAALLHYNKAIELEPTNMTFYNNVAGMLI